MFFYVENIDKGVLEGSEAEHFLSMRVKIGDKISVCDQIGTKVKVEITELDKNKKIMQFHPISQFEKGQEMRNCTLFQAITDKSYLEKMVEIVPLSPITDMVLFRSQFSPPGSYSLERLQKIITRSCEQSQRLFGPNVSVVSYENMLEMVSEYRPLVLECGHENQLETTSLPNSVIVGPEGGWSPKELEDFDNASLTLFQMGSQIYPAWLAGYSYFTKFC
jgi:RsmE family RNA methyltransferase